MRRALAASVAVAALALSGCASTGGGGGIVVTTSILGDVVAQLVDEGTRVATLMPPGADPHSFELSAAEAAELRSAGLVVSSGLGLEEGLQHHVDAAAEDAVPVVAAGDFVEPITWSDAGESGPDPHFWTDPTQMALAVEGLAEALGDTADPARVDAYLAELDALDEELEASFGSIPQESRALVTNHHVFGYLAERYGFRILGAVIPSGTTLAAPSARDLEDLVQAIDEAGVCTIFADSSQPDRLATVLAEEAQLEVRVVPLFTESLSEPGEGGGSYLEMMRTNAERIVDGLA